MKNARQTVILSIIEEREVQTQEELAQILTEMGIKVTQATVSRDIKELRLLKVLSPNGGYRYATADRAEHGVSERFVRMFVESVLSIQEVNNLIVIRTLSGSANVAGEAIDNMRWPEILGTICGDNTILVILNTSEDAVEVANRFRESIRVSR